MKENKRAAWGIHFSLSSTTEWCDSWLRSYFHFFLVTECDLVCRTNRHSFLYCFFGQNICQGNRNRIRKLCEGCGDFLFHLCILSINFTFFQIKNSFKALWNSAFYTLYCFQMFPGLNEGIPSINVSLWFYLKYKVWFSSCDSKTLYEIFMHT